MVTKTAAEIKRELAALKKQYQQTAKEEFLAGFNVLFDKYPELHSVGFKAYTSYFCDGDPCTYGVYHDEPEINGFAAWGDDDDEENKHRNLWEESKTNKESEKLIDEVQTFLGAFDNDIYLDMVGNDVEVTITRKGIKTTDYTEHD